MADDTGVDIDDRLKIELKLVFFQGMADTLFPMDFFLQAGCAAALLESVKGVTP